MNWNISNHQIQDVLERMGMLDDNGQCPYTTEEVFKGGMEFGFDEVIKWLRNNVDSDHDYPNSTEELINDLMNHFGIWVNN